MREAIKEYIEQLQLSAVENRKRADKAYEDEDLGLSGFIKDNGLRMKERQ